MIYCAKLFERTANLFMFPRVSIAFLMVLRDKKKGEIQTKKLKRNFER